jgi:hypothetical protein
MAPSHLVAWRHAVLATLLTAPAESRPVPARRISKLWDCKVTPAYCGCQGGNTIGCISSNDGLDAGPTDCFSTTEIHGLFTSRADAGAKARIDLGWVTQPIRPRSGQAAEAPLFHGGASVLCRVRLNRRKSAGWAGDCGRVEEVCELGESKVAGIRRCRVSGNDKFSGCGGVAIGSGVSPASRGT